MYGSPFDDYPYYDRPRQKHPDTEDRLRHVVYLDGRLIDTWTERVEGTSYQSWALELDRASTRSPRSPEVPPPPHEAVLNWLDGVVGGRTALLVLDDGPLGPVERPEGTGEAYAEIEAVLERVCRNHFDNDDEVHLAMNAALAELWRADPDLVSGMPAEIAGALCWLVGRANGRVGAGTPVTQQVLKRELWLKAGLSGRATRFKERLRDLLPAPSHRPASCPSLLEVGHPALLTSATRRDLVRLRDRALEAAAVMAADAQARGPVTPPLA